LTSIEPDPLSLWINTAFGNHLYWARLALVHAGLGDNGRALEFLERAGEERSPRLVFLGVEPAFDGLREDPRFAALRRKLGLP
jgi:hypothetical protein